MAVVIIILAVLTFVALESSLIMSPELDCIQDKIFDLTSNLNNYFAQHIAAKHTFMIICGLMMDIMIIVSFYRFALKGSTWRFPIALLIFYGVRFMV